MDVVFKEEEVSEGNIENPEVDNEVILETEEDYQAGPDEEIVVIPEREDSEFRETEAEAETFEDDKDIPPPTDEFLSVFDNIKSSENGEALENLRFLAWKQYYEAEQQVVMEGKPRAWMACAVYMAMINRRFSRFHDYPFTLSDIQQVSGVSVLELFDKLERYMQIIGSSKRIKEHVQKIQGNLAVSAVVFKKLLPVFRNLFLNSRKTLAGVSSFDILKILWNMFVVVKKALISEDLLSSFHLLLCVVEIIYDEVRYLEIDDLVNPEFSDKLIESESSILEFLCRSFGGVVLDAKHFKAHWFNTRKISVLNISSESRFITLRDQFLTIWSESYLETILRRGEVDERMFLPTTDEDFERIFNEAYDGTAVELLRRGPDDSTFADVDLLLRMSTQQCLEKLTEYKKVVQQASKTYILSSENLYPSSPMTHAIENPTRLAAIVPENWQLVGSELEQLCEEMRDNPLTTIACNAENLAQRFADKVMEEAKEFGPDYDPTIFNSLEKHQEFLADLFYVIVENIVRSERDRFMGREGEICGVLRKEEFLASVFCCCLEMLLFSYNSARTFPWSVQMCDLSPICFHKVTELVVRSVPELSREIVRHLNKKEEEVLEELAWQSSSPLWVVLARRPGGVPTCETAWRQQRPMAENYSPIKRRKREDGTQSPVNLTTGNVTMHLFFRKVFYLASMRMTDICERVRMSDVGRRMSWALLEHLLRNETTLMLNRHLDQNILCILYVVAKSLKMSCTFMDVIAEYRHQPQARSFVYREVTVDSTVQAGTPSEDGNSRDSLSGLTGPPRLRCGSTIPLSSVPGTPEPTSVEKVDLIKYYNTVFLPRLEDFVKGLQDEDVQERLNPMPKPQGFGLSPMKKVLADRVHVQPLYMSGGGTERRYKYNINQTPRKDLMAINRVISMGAQQSPYFTDTPEKTIFGTVYRR